jgi:hypothetical protein
LARARASAASITARFLSSTAAIGVLRVLVPDRPVSFLRFLRQPLGVLGLIARALVAIEFIA